MVRPSIRRLACLVATAVLLGIVVLVAARVSGTAAPVREAGTGSQALQSLCDTPVANVQGQGRLAPLAGPPAGVDGWLMACLTPRASRSSAD